MKTDQDGDDRGPVRPSPPALQSLLLRAHDHLLRVTVRRRTGAGGRVKTEYRVVRESPTCRRCAVLGSRLIRATYQFRVPLEKLLADDR